MRRLVQTHDEDSDDVPPRFLGFSSADWHYVSKDDLNGVSFGPVPSHKPGDDWTLTFKSEYRKGTEAPFLNIQMPPRIIRELYTEVKNVPAEVPQIADEVECELCGELVPYERAVPNDRHRPVHRGCYVDEYDAGEWVK